MSAFLNQLPEIINKLFDVLDLLVVRLLLFILIVLGAYALLKRHSPPKPPSESPPNPPASSPG
jgi:hypothetical protein